MAKSEREKRLDRIYREMHRDFKGKVNGVRTVMVLRGGSCLVALNDLTDEEIDRLDRPKRA